MKRLVRISILIVVIGAGLSAALLYPAIPTAATDRPPATGWMEQFSFIEPPRPAAQVPFLTPDGAEVTLADFKGRVLVVNFWATWCAPCVKELPSLDRLQLELGGEGLLVLAISQDRGGVEVAAPFLKDLDINRLGLFLDPKMKLGRAFGVRALPWTVVIDREGNVVGELPGLAEWDSPEAIRLLRHYLDAGRAEKPEPADCQCRPTPPKKLNAG